jgi:hemerythrin
MSIFAWKDEYSVGNADIDAEHRALFRIAEEVHSAILEGADEDKLEGLFTRLANYVETHSRNDKRLSDKVQALHRRIEKGQARVDVETMRFVRSWLDHHIRLADHGSDAKKLTR